MFMVLGVNKIEKKGNTEEHHRLYGQTKAVYDPQVQKNNNNNLPILLQIEIFIQVHITYDIYL
jgi:hypothetical protein